MTFTKTYSPKFTEIVSKVNKSTSELGLTDFRC